MRWADQGDRPVVREPRVPMVTRVRNGRSESFCPVPKTRTSKEQLRSKRLRAHLLVVLLEALLGHNAPGHRVLAERGWHAAYLVVALVSAPGPVIAVPPPRPYLLGILVPVELETFSRRCEIGFFSVIEERRLVATWCHSPT